MCPWGDCGTSQDACGTVVVSGGGFTGEYSYIGKNHDFETWASDRHTIFFIDTSERRRLEAGGDAHGERLSVRHARLLD